MTIETNENKYFECSDPDKVLVEEIQVIYSQDSDCTESNDLNQTLTITTRDGGGGKFFNIKTDGWSVSPDSPTILTDIIYDFMKRAK